MNYQNIEFSVADGIARVTINRPKTLNALNQATIRELCDVFNRQLGQQVRCVILTGAGDRAFVAGADINEIASQSPVGALEFARIGQQLMRDIAHCGVPVVARVNGFALGGGCELMLACHIRIASDNAKIGLPEINLGIMPGFGGTQRLSRICSPAVAMEMALTGEPIDAAKALSLGLVSQVVSFDDLDAACDGLANKLVSKAPIAASQIISAINNGTEMALDQALEMESQLFAVTCSTDDRREGTSAFLEKRKAQFTGQ